MDEKLARGISAFVTCRVNDMGADMPIAVTKAIEEVETRKERLADALTQDQATHLRKLVNALSLQVGEEIRYYYCAGFGDAIQFLLDWRSIDE